jgi:hypothetical protein
VDRREFLIGTGTSASASLLTCITGASGQLGPSRHWGEKAPYRTLYNNDSTNLLSCYSPWSNPGNNSHPEVFSTQLIDASVAEVAGKVDVQLFCPGLCWVPWWKSKVYPATEHYPWYYDLIKDPKGPFDPYARYMLDGGDMVRDFLNACRSHRQTAFVSFRLNDVQFLQTAANGKTVTLTSKMCKFWYENSAYVRTDNLFTLGNNYLNNPQRAQNWANPEVRNYKLSFIRELCRYDIDGLELDFNRYANYFPADSDPRANQEIMVAFVKAVRAALDEGPAPDPASVEPLAEGNDRRHRYLSVRVPSFLDVYQKLGISLPAFVAAGVDMVNVSDGYYTTNESDLPLIRSSIPETSIYFEATQTTNVTSTLPDGSRPFLRTTDQQFHTAANIAYRQGANGISLFNFAYYRQTSNEIASDPGEGPFNEPPFHVLESLRHRKDVAGGPQWHVLAVDHDSYISPSMQMPKTLHDGQSFTFTLSMYPRGKQPEGILRVRIEPPAGYTSGPVPAWDSSVELNDTPLEPASFVAAPLKDPYSANLVVDATRFCCFKVDRGTVQEGQNSIRVTLLPPASGTASKVTLDYLDVTWPAES